METPEGLQPMWENICVAHIRDNALLAQVQSVAHNSAPCSYCGRPPGGTRSTATVDMNVVARVVYETISSRYRDFVNASVFDGEAWETPLDTDEVVAGVAGDAFEEEVSEAVLRDITEAVATPTQWFEDDIRDQFSYSWDRFAETVRHETRFVFVGQPRPGGENEPPALLAQFLEGLLGYADKSAHMVRPLPPGSVLYRGRMTDDPEALLRDARREPARILGVAPTNRAAPGRMSGEGVSLFYGADNVHTAVAEIALHSPYDHAVIGEFVTQRSLTILDFTRKPRLPSIFDAAHREQRMFTEFVDDFVDAITRPVVLDGRERVDYLPTQIVTEYLRWVPRRRIDGIAFPSRADSSGKNVVLFVGLDGDVLSAPPTTQEQVKFEMQRRIGGNTDPALTISPSTITEHSVTRSVRVKAVRSRLLR